jgi:oligopeptide transport system ATP-binding protein
MKSLQDQLGMAIIMITHDLGVVAQLCDEIIVMYAGSICERGTAEDIFYDPHHSYTKGLLKSIPTVDMDDKKLEPITGTPIDLLNMPKGCPFAPRCDDAMHICINQTCDYVQINEHHYSACWMNVKEMMEEQKGGASNE